MCFYVNVNIEKEKLKKNLPFVKKIMSGHDYYEDINFCNQHPHIKGVKIAVEEMLGMPNKKYKDGSWLIVKK